MSCAKQECVDYVEFVRKIEEHEIDGWSYGIDNRRADLHDRLCDAYGVDLAKGKSETIVVFGRVSKKRVGVLKLRTKTSFEIMGVRKVNPT